MIYIFYENIIFKKCNLIEDRIREEVATLVSKLPITITPNLITIVSFILGILSAINFAFSNILVGIILYYTSDVLDGVDGIIARRKNMSTLYGAYLDSCLDRYVDAAILLGICIHLSNAGYIWIIWIIGIFAIIGSFMISYTTHRAEALGKVVLPSFILLHRRTRMHIVIIGAILNQLFWALIILALVCNLNVFWRMMPWMLRDFNSVGERIKKSLPKTSIKKFQENENAIKKE
ncbi:MAG: CDP-alcohol phosphatidyltransferase family protein [Candidatus Methanofastidiosia archaeon]